MAAVGLLCRRGPVVREHVVDGAPASFRASEEFVVIDPVFFGVEGVFARHLVLASALIEG